MGGSRRADLRRRLPGVAGAGLAGWLVDVTVLWVAHAVFAVPSPAAAAAGFIASGIVNYTVNRLVFTERGSPGGRRLRRYAVLFAANLVAVSVAVPLLADGLHTAVPALPAALIAAKVVVTAALLPVNTVIYGAWVFTASSGARAVAPAAAVGPAPAVGSAVGLGDNVAGAGWLVVCPALNESASIAGVVAEITEAVPEALVLVVDDGSTDATAAVARAAGARVLRLPFNIGVGAAVRVGLLFASRHGIGVVVQCDADGQHPADAIAALVAGLADADVVLGARWAGSGAYRARGPRRWAMTLLARVLSAVHHTRLDDVTSGFRAFGPRAVEVLSAELPPEYLGDTLDALVIARARGLRVRQVPVAFRARSGGVPSHAPARSAFYLFRAVLVLAVSLLRLAGPRRSASRRLPGPEGAR